MMKNKRLVIIAAVLVAVTAAAAAVHLMTRDEVTAGCVELIFGGKSRDIAVSDLKKEDVKGIRVNGKGEEIEVDAKGISLAALLEDVSGYDKVTVISDDSYSAEIAADELDKAFIIVEKDEARLVVFGDSNSKRSVSNVKQIVVE